MTTTHASDDASRERLRDPDAPDASRSQSAFVLLGYIAATFAASGLGAWLTGDPSSGWYASLEKPSFNPPNAVFGPVWTFLYLAMAFAAWLVHRKAGFTGAHRLWAIQLALNVLWSALFFRFHMLGAAMIEIVVLWLAILATLLAFWRIARPAGALFVPYLAWVSFAAVLNASIWRLNG